MLRALLIASWLCALGCAALAQQNCPLTPAAGTSNTTCANTAFVQKQIASKNYVVGPNSSVDSDVALFSGASGALLKDGGAFSSLLSSNLNAVLAPLLRSYIAGLTLSFNSTTVLNIAAGVADDSTNAALISLAAFTKSTGGAWAAGSGSNGMGNSLTITSSTWYHVCLANNSGSPDIWFDTSAVCANRPSGISDTKFRRIGSFKTDGSAHIISFVQDGDQFTWVTPVTDISVTNPGTAAVTRTLASVPLGVRVGAILYTGALATASADVAADIYLTDLNVTDSAPGVVTFSSVTSFGGVTTTNYQFGGMVNVMTNASQQIRSRIAQSGTSTQLAITTLGWIDTRGRLN